MSTPILRWLIAVTLCLSVFLIDTSDCLPRLKGNRWEDLERRHNQQNPIFAEVQPVEPKADASASSGDSETKPSTDDKALEAKPDKEKVEKVDEASTGAQVDALKDKKEGGTKTDDKQGETKPKEKDTVKDKGANKPDKTFCTSVRCFDPPRELDCKVRPPSATPTHLAGLTSDCCQVHICRRFDGSTFLHYGFEVEDAPPPQPAPANSFVRPLFPNGFFGPGGILRGQAAPGSLFPQQQQLQYPGFFPPQQPSFNERGRPFTPASRAGGGPPQQEGFAFGGMNFPFGAPFPTPQNNRVAQQFAPPTADGLIPQERVARFANPEEPAQFPLARGFSEPAPSVFESFPRERRQVEAPAGGLISPGGLPFGGVTGIF